MYQNNDFVYEAIGVLEQESELCISVESIREKADIILTIQGLIFYGRVKKTSRRTNYSFITEVVESKRPDKNEIVIADYLTQKTIEVFRENEINYLDTAGNCLIKANGLYIQIDKKQTNAKTKSNLTRAFQEAGLKLIMLLLTEPDALQLSYRALAEKSNISLGSISNILDELEEKNFLLRTEQKRLLKNKPELLEQWVLSYKEILKPRCFRKRMKALRPIDYQYLIGDPSLNLFFGGEPGGDLLTHNLVPKDFTIYTNESLNVLGQEFQWVPSEEGRIFIYEKFWGEKFPNPREGIAPKLVIYADLMNSGDARNIETAKLILKDGLAN